jgi:hypothetical protein
MILTCSLYAFVNGLATEAVAIWAIDIEYIKMSWEVAKDDGEASQHFYCEVILRVEVKHKMGESDIDTADASGLRRGFVDSVG